MIVNQIIEVFKKKYAKNLKYYEIFIEKIIKNYIEDL